MPPPSLPSDPNLLKMVLTPLLEDFQFWLERSRSLLESEQLGFLTPEEQTDLLEQVVAAQQEVRSSQSLFHAMGAQVGISMSTVVPWHKLVTECWHVALRNRRAKANAETDDSEKSEG